MSNYLKKLFEDYEEQPAPEMWDKVMSDVNRHNKIVKARKIGIGAAVMVAAGVAAVMLLRGGSTPEQTQTAVAKAQQPVAEATAISPAAQPSAQMEEQPMAQAQPAVDNASADKKNSQADQSTPAKETAKPNVPSTAVHPDTEKQTVPALPVIASTSVNPAAVDKAPAAQPAPATSTAVAQHSTTNTANTAPAKSAMRSGSNPDSSTVVTDNTVRVQIPTGITPDKSENNIFSVTFDHPQLVKSYELSIFTRNGLMVFHSKDMNQGWDGKYKGRIQSMGAYAYVLIYTTANGQRQVEKGTVTIVR